MTRPHLILALGLLLGILVTRAVFAASPAARVSRSFRSVTLGSDFDRGQREGHEASPTAALDSPWPRASVVPLAPPSVSPTSESGSSPAPRPSVELPAVAPETVEKAPPRPASTPLKASGSSIPAAKAWALRQLGATQYACFDKLMVRESGWDPAAANPKGASPYNPKAAWGIPQSLPGSKMAAAGADWVTNPVTQVRWAIEFYIPSTYGSACRALAHSYALNWY